MSAPKHYTPIMVIDMVLDMLRVNHLSLAKITLATLREQLAANEQDPSVHTRRSKPYIDGGD